MCQAFLKIRKNSLLLGNKVQKIEEGYKEFFSLTQFRQEAEMLENKLFASLKT